MSYSCYIDGDASLGYCELGDKGVIALVGALKQMKTLCVLKLGSNKIGPVGAIAVASFLKRTPVLEQLT